MSAIVSIVKVPFMIFIWMIKHPRVLLLAVGLIFVFFAMNTCSHVFAGNSKTTPKIQTYQQTAPDITLAPYVLATQSRIYYVAKYEGNTDNITLLSYYEYFKNKWTLRAETLLIDKTLYPGARLYERKTDKVIISF